MAKLPGHRELWSATEVLHRTRCGRRLLAARTAAGLSKHDIARTLGLLDGSVIGYYENNLMMPGIPRQLELASIVDVHPDELWAYGPDWEEAVAAHGH